MDIILNVRCGKSRGEECRGVAQFGRALRSGRRGRVFESHRLDHQKTASNSYFSAI